MKSSSTGSASRFSPEEFSSKILQLVSAREGHFLLESGYHANLWFDLEPLFLRPIQLRPFVIDLAARLGNYNPQAVCGPLVGGAFLAQMVAFELGIEFYFAERITPIPSEKLYPVTYRVPDALRPDLRNRTVAIVDDAISAGSAVRGTFTDLLACGARPVAIGALLILGSSALQFAKEYNVDLEGLSYLDYRLWSPFDCPICKTGSSFEKT